MSVATTVSTRKPSQIRTDLFVVPVDAGRSIPAGLSPVTHRQLKALMRKVAFRGEWGSAELFIAPRGIPAAFVAVVGIGEAKQPIYHQKEGMRRGVARIVQEARRQALRQLAVLLPTDERAAQLAAAASEAVELSDYRFADHRPKLAEEQQARSVRKLTFLSARQQVAAVRDALSAVQDILVGIIFTRDLVNQPASHLSPHVLVQRARAIGKSSPRMKVLVLNRRQAERAKFTAFLAVARGSSQEPYVIHLMYRPQRKGGRAKKVVLVGKGVTFDSGGLSLKPAQYMENMKIDMAGAATVLGVFSSLPKLNLDIEVHGIIAACENMPSGDAYRPGDVVVAKNGKTIEVLNTDAEGRVTLADSLSYAVEQKPDVIIDLATLTGASVIALGDTYAGLWSNDDQLRDQLLEAARETAEGLVAFPLPEEYRPLIESKLADVKNVSANHPVGAAITAALFLQEFVDDGTPWAHLDIAGPVYAERPVLPYYVYGGTGYGVRTLLEFLKNLAAEPAR
jgi:leucyl aminopeptidase